MGTGSSLLSTFDRISRGALQITDIRALKTLNDRQLKTTRDLKKMLKYFNEDLDRLLKRDRIHADAKKNAEATLRRYRAEFERELACLGSEHALVQDVAPLFDPLPGKIAKLGGKDRYADAGPLIQNLRDIKSELEGLGISNDNAYQEQVNTIALKIEAAESRFDGMRPRMHSADIDTVGGLMQEIEGLFAPHGQERQMHQEDQRYAAVENLYRTFAERYSNRDLGGVMACLDDAWHSSGDGTTLMDLEDNLRNSFSMFNEVSFIMEDLSIRRSGYQHFRVKYLVTINGYSYETDITHEETSTVTEIVKVENDRARIVETVNGRYWIRR